MTAQEPLIEETVWLGDTPIATLRPSGSGASIYHIHSDALNTPRQVTHPSDNTPLWNCVDNQGVSAWISYPGREGDAGW
jgi:hypothetical protein